MNCRYDGPLQQICKFSILTPIKNSSSPYKDNVPPTDGSSSLIVKTVLEKPPPYVRGMMLFHNDDVAHSPQSYSCYGGAFLGCGEDCGVYFAIWRLKGLLLACLLK